jgi:hypothetical protein
MLKWSWLFILLAVLIQSQCLLVAASDANITTLLRLNYDSESAFREGALALYQYLNTDSDDGGIRECEFIDGMMKLSTDDQQLQERTFTGFESFSTKDGIGANAKNGWRMLWRLLRGSNGNFFRGLIVHANWVDSLMVINEQALLGKYRNAYTKPVEYRGELCQQALERLESYEPPVDDQLKWSYQLMQNGKLIESLRHQCTKGFSSLNDYATETCLIQKEGWAMLKECLSNDAIKKRNQAISSRFLLWIAMGSIEFESPLHGDVSVIDWASNGNQTEIDALLTQEKLPLNGRWSKKVESERMRIAIQRAIDELKIRNETVTASSVNETLHTLAPVRLHDGPCEEKFTRIINCHSSDSIHDLVSVLHDYDRCLGGYFVVLNKQPIYLNNLTNATTCADIRHAVKVGAKSLVPVSNGGLQKRGLLALSFFLQTLFGLSQASFLLPVLIVSALLMIILIPIVINTVTVLRFYAISRSQISRLNRTQPLIPARAPGLNRGAGPIYDPFPSDLEHQSDCQAIMYWGSCGVPTSDISRQCPDGGNPLYAQSCTSFVHFYPGSLMCGMRPGGQGHKELKQAQASWRNQTGLTKSAKWTYQWTLWKYMCQSLCVKYEGKDC